MVGFDTTSWGPYTNVDESIQKIIDSLNALKDGGISNAGTIAGKSLEEIYAYTDAAKALAMQYTDNYTFDASKVVSGVFDIARIPAAALERMISVVDQVARFALTTADVQVGDCVLQLDTGIMYWVINTESLANENGYHQYNAGTAAAVPWTGITGKPDTLSGYGLQTEADGRYAPNGHGVGTLSVSVSNTNMNDLRTNGFYSGTGMINSPDPDEWWKININTHAGVGFVTQEIISYGLGGTYPIGTRLQRDEYGNGDWSPWRQLTFTDNPEFTGKAKFGSFVFSENAGFGLTKGGIARFGWYTDGVAESGSNAGSNLALYRYSDAGSSLGVVMSVNRASGVVSIPNWIFSSPGLRIFDTNTLSGNSYTTLAQDIVGGFIETKDSKPFRIWAGGAERIRIAANGNFGVGIDPLYNMDVAGNNNANGIVSRFKPATSNSYGVVLGTNGSNGYGMIQGVGWTNAADKLLLNPFGGNVCIGVATNPLYKLDMVEPKDVANNLIRIGVNGVTNGFLGFSDALNNVTFAFGSGAKLAVGHVTPKAVLHSTGSTILGCAMTVNWSDIGNSQIGIQADDTKCTLSWKDSGGIQRQLVFTAPAAGTSRTI